jgi:hypothetical protein
VARHRREILAGTYGEVLEIVFGTGLNLPFYPPDVRKITTVQTNTGMEMRRPAVTLGVDRTERRAMSRSRRFWEGPLTGTVAGLFGGSIAYTIRDPYHVAWLLLRAAGQSEYYTAHGWLPARDPRLWFALATGLLVGTVLGFGRMPSRQATEWFSALGIFSGRDCPIAVCHCGIANGFLGV